MMSSKTDEDEKIAIGVVLLIVAAVVASVLGFGGWKALAQKGVDATQTAATAGQTEAAAETAAAQAAPVSAPLADDASAIRIENGVVKFYFATGKAELAQGANEALVDVVKAAAAGKKLKISGYHDSTGDAAKNAELAKQRALGVKAALAGLGVTDSAMEMVKPAVSEGSGSNAEARRVEVSIVD